MVFDELDKIGSNFSALMISPISALQDSLTEVMRGAASRKVPVLFLSLNKPNESINKVFTDAGIDTGKVFYVDCIAKSLGAVTRRKNVIHIENAADLTSLNIAVSEFLEKIEGSKYVIVDALATLLIYNPEEMVIKFVSSVVKQSQDARLVCFTPSAKGTAFIEKISVYFDEVREIT